MCLLTVSTPKLPFCITPEKIIVTWCWVCSMVKGETESLGANMLSWFCISSMVELYEFFFCSMLGIQCTVFTQHLCPLKCTHCLRCDSTAYAVQCRSTCCGVRSGIKGHCIQSYSTSRRREAVVETAVSCQLVFQNYILCYNYYSMLVLLEATATLTC